jgi:cell division protein FtsI (penicillin-binding protein 3)
VNPAAHPQLSLRLPAWRTRFVFALFATGFVVLMARALYLQGPQRAFLQKEGASRYASRPLLLSAHRGMITDRNGEPLAISTPVESVWASPGDVDITPTQRERLAQLLGIEPEELKTRLAGRARDFVYLKRHLPPEQAAKVVQLDLPGVFLQREYRRYYPAGETLSHVIGFTDVDDNGQEGLELAYQDWLAGRPGSRRVIRDRLGRVVEDVESIRAPQEGRDMQLSIDLKLQYLAYRELKAAVNLHQAKAGGILVLDVRTGEVLALANVPTYNPNNRAHYDAVRARNRAITDLFEPGSTLKPFTVAAALESGAFRADTVIATAGGSLTLGPATIRDAHVSPINLTVAQVIQRSSNVGTAKMALALPSQRLWEMFTAAGFGASPHSGFPGEAGGRLRDYHTWRPIEQATMSYGHGISVSLMQLARAYTIFCSDGELLPVTLVRRDEPVAGMRVVSAETAAILRHMMQTVTEPGGTAPRAQVPGYHVAGKTGTAHKLVDGQYAPDRYASSFIGFAPASSPRLLIAVLIDEPGGGQYYGGQVAAPVFSAVMAGALRMLAIPPDMPVFRKGPIDAIPDVAEEV